MKVTCEYCDSYVDVEDGTTCPCCGAPIGDAVKAAQKKQAEQAAAEQAAAEEKAEEEAKQEKTDTLLKGLFAGLTGLAGASALGRQVQQNPFGQNRRPQQMSRRPDQGFGGGMGHGPGNGGFGGGMGHGPGGGGFGGGHGGPGGRH